MRRLRWVLFLIFLYSVHVLEAQKKENKYKDFFTDEKMLHIKITTDVKNLLAEKKSLKDVEAFISCTFPDSTVVGESIKLKQRGHFRRDNCYLSSLTLFFNSNPANKLAPLKSVKMVGGCGKSNAEEQYLLKEFLAYKMYNLLTDFSFRIRLVHVTYVDSKKKVKSFSQCAFLMEDIDDVAKRNNHQQKKLVSYSPKGTHRYQTTLMSIFQYMIGNTDWSIPNYHNIKLVVPRKDTNNIPLPIAYDFDMTGLVNPNYAGTSPLFDIEKVTDRLYRGFPVSVEEVQTVVNLFLGKEKEMISLINNFELLNNKNKSEMVSFLNGFYTEIKNKSKVKSLFITNARKY